MFTGFYGTKDHVFWIADNEIEKLVWWECLLPAETFFLHLSGCGTVWVSGRGVVFGYFFAWLMIEIVPSWFVFLSLVDSSIGLHYGSIMWANSTGFYFWPLLVP
jgi:hypothetical protein